MKIMHVVGARPNFMKTAPIMAEMQRHPEQFVQILVHTGQHYDARMSDVFLSELNLPHPDEFLNVGSGSHAEQTARIMLAFEPVLLRHRPDWVIVVGDVNSTLACALVAAKLGFPVAHVEAGLRSGDSSMPEEVNRVLTDRIADLLFTPSADANANLLAEGIPEIKIKFVGNVMIDSLLRALPTARSRSILSSLNLPDGRFALATLHRPANVDDPRPLTQILSALRSIADSCPVVFPMHPRTAARVAALEEVWKHPGIRVIEPLGYLDFVCLQCSASLVVTDSGGVQEETAVLGTPCLTVRATTERPVTLTAGCNRLVASQSDAIVDAAHELLSRAPTPPRPPHLWDGNASARIVEVMLQHGAGNTPMGDRSAPRPQRADLPTLQVGGV